MIRCPLICWMALLLLIATPSLQKASQSDSAQTLSLLKHLLRTESLFRFVLPHADPTSDFLSWLHSRPASPVAAAKKDYFGSYSHPAVHLTMLRDLPRTESYLQTAVENAKHFRDKVVLDVGCGTAVLSFFAAWAGARHVYCVENAEIADYAKKIVRDNNMTEKITVVRGRAEDVVLPVDKVDIIISEWMGTFLLYESMLDSVLVARDRFLRDGGIMLPDQAEIFVAGFEGSDLRETFINSWSNVEGIDMSAIKELALSSPKIGTVIEEDILTTESTVLSLDLYRTTAASLNFVHPFNLVAKRNGTLQGLAGWFRVDFFSSPERVSDGVPLELSTGPSASATHWRQVAFFLDEEVVVVEGETVVGTIGVKKSGRDERFLDVRIQVSYHGRVRSDRVYHID